MSDVDLRPYLLGRMQEMQRIDPSYWGALRQEFIRQFGKPSNVDDSLHDDERQSWWLHGFAAYRIDRLKRQHSSTKR